MVQQVHVIVIAHNDSTVFPRNRLFPILRNLKSYRHYKPRDSCLPLPGILAYMYQKICFSIRFISINDLIQTYAIISILPDNISGGFHYVIYRFLCRRGVGLGLRQIAQTKQETQIYQNFQCEHSGTYPFLLHGNRQILTS